MLCYMFAPVYELQDHCKLQLLTRSPPPLSFSSSPQCLLLTFRDRNLLSAPAEQPHLRVAMNTLYTAGKVGTII